MWSQTYDPVGGSLQLSALVAVLPVFVVLVVLGVFRKPAWVAAMSGFVTSAIVSVTAYHMPLPLAVSAAARLFAGDPDRDRARASFRALWPHLVAWLSWIERARNGPHGASVIVHPWEAGMDNSPSWDQSLSVVPEVGNEHIERRDVATVSADQRPSSREYRQYLGIVEVLRTAGWNTERQPADSPFVVEDPGFTAITARAGRTFWLNPEPRLYWNYGDSVIAAYEQHCHAFECWRTDQLEEFVKALAQPVVAGY